MNLYFVIDGVEYPLSFDFDIINGISGSIPYKELRSGEVFLRLEGMTLAS